MNYNDYQICGGVELKVVKGGKATDEEIRNANRGLLNYAKNNMVNILAGTVAVAIIGAGTIALAQTNDKSHENVKASMTMSTQAEEFYNAQAGADAFSNLPLDRQNEIVDNYIKNCRANSEVQEKTKG